MPFYLQGLHEVTLLTRLVLRCVAISPTLPPRNSPPNRPDQQSAVACIPWLSLPLLRALVAPDLSFLTHLASLTHLVDLDVSQSQRPLVNEDFALLSSKLTGLTSLRLRDLSGVNPDWKPPPVANPPQGPHSALSPVEEEEEETAEEARPLLNQSAASGRPKGGNMYLGLPQLKRLHISALPQRQDDEGISVRRLAWVLGTDARLEVLSPSCSLDTACGDFSDQALTIETTLALLGTGLSSCSSTLTLVHMLGFSGFNGFHLFHSLKVSTDPDFVNMMTHVLVDLDLDLDLYWYFGAHWPSGCYNLFFSSTACPWACPRSQVVPCRARQGVHLGLGPGHAIAHNADTI